MFKLSVPVTVQPQYEQDYLDSLAAALRCKHGGNTVRRDGETYYDNAACDAHAEPQLEQAMYEDMIRKL